MSCGCATRARKLADWLGWRHRENPSRLSRGAGGIVLSMEYRTVRIHHFRVACLMLLFRVFTIGMRDTTKGA